MKIEEKAFLTAQELLNYLNKKNLSTQEEPGLFAVDFSKARGIENKLSIFQALLEPMFLEHLPQMTELRLPGLMALGARTLEISNAALKSLNFLRSSRCRSGLILNLWGHAVTDPGDPNVDVFSNQLSDALAGVLADLLSTGLCPEGLELNLAFNLFGHRGTQAIANTLSSGLCSAGLSLNLYFSTCIQGTRTIAEALERGWSECSLPNGLKIELSIAPDIDSDLLARVESVLRKNNQLHWVESAVCIEQVIEERLDPKKLCDKDGMFSLITKFLPSSVPECEMKSGINITHYYRHLMKEKGKSRQPVQFDDKEESQHEVASSDHNPLCHYLYLGKKKNSLLLQADDTDYETSLCRPF